MTSGEYAGLILGLRSDLLNEGKGVMTRWVSCCLVKTEGSDLLNEGKGVMTRLGTPSCWQMLNSDLLNEGKGVMTLRGEDGQDRAEPFRPSK